MTRYRAAIVGTGAIAAAHARAVRAHADRIELVAVVDVDPARAAAFAAEWDVPTIAPDLTMLLANKSGEIAETDATDETRQISGPDRTGGTGRPDLVHICTPPATHAPLALQCLRAGSHVLLEKPPTLSLTELDTLAEAARQSGAYLATVFQHRFGSGMVRLRRMATAGELGKPLLATCDTLWYRDDAYYAVPWRGRWDTEGGGPTMGHGIHQFDMLLSVLGPWEQVTAVAARRARPVQTEDVSMALVTFASGAVASVVNSVLSPRQVSALRFDFEHATIELSHLYGYTDENWTITPAAGRDDVFAKWHQDTTKGEITDHSPQLGSVLDALDNNEEPPVTIADTRQTMEFVAALYASAFTGRPVQRGDIGPGHPFATSMNGTGARWGSST